MRLQRDNTKEQFNLCLTWIIGLKPVALFVVKNGVFGCAEEFRRTLIWTLRVTSSMSHRRKHFNLSHVRAQGRYNVVISSLRQWLRIFHFKRAWYTSLIFHQGPVVQSVVSLTSSLRVISLTILADSMYNIMIFFSAKTQISAYTRITWSKFLTNR